MDTTDDIYLIANELHGIADMENRTADDVLEEYEWRLGTVDALT